MQIALIAVTILSSFGTVCRQSPRCGAIKPFANGGRQGALPLQIVSSDRLVWRINQIRCQNLAPAFRELSCQHLPLNVLTPQKLQKVPNLIAGAP